MLACGFIYAVRQQILAVDYGYRTEALRREREELLDEQRRLKLALEESSSPARLEEAGRELGMQPARAAQIDSATRERRAEPGVFVGTAGAALGRR
jgi:cell division protein FtsL